jgi:transposase
MSRRLLDGQKPQVDTSKITGRKSALELNPDLIKNITNLVRQGMYPSVACSMFGVHRQRITEWVAKGRENPDSLYAAFADALHKAIAEAEARDLSTVDSHANGRPAIYERDKDGNLVMDSEGKPILLRAEIRPNWLAAAWKLERRSPKRWGRFDRIHMTAESEMSEIDVTHTTSGADKQVTEEQKNDALKEVSDILENLKLRDEYPES